MKGKEIISHITQTKMPDLEQVREICHRKSYEKPYKKLNTWVLRLASVSACAVLIVAAVFIMDRLGDTPLDITPPDYAGDHAV
jgi:hypothetical protein